MTYGSSVDVYDQTINDLLSLSLIAIIIFFILIVLVIYLIIAIGLWKIFEKAGIEKWKAFVPFMNSYYLYQLSMGKGWIYFLSFVPYIGPIISMIQKVHLTQVFGKDVQVNRDKVLLRLGLVYEVLTVLFSPIMCLVFGFSENIHYIGEAKDSRLNDGTVSGENSQPNEKAVSL